MDQIYKALEEIEQIRENQKQLARKIETLLAFIKNECVHPEDKIVRKQQYYEGSYYDVSRTKYWNECSICGAKSEEKTVHGYYA